MTTIEDFSSIKPLIKSRQTSQNKKLFGFKFISITCTTLGGIHKVRDATFRLFNLHVPKRDVLYEMTPYVSHLRCTQMLFEFVYIFNHLKFTISRRLPTENRRSLNVSIVRVAVMWTYQRKSQRLLKVLFWVSLVEH